MKKIIISGNPNSGKTTIFNLLTDSSLKTGNWHGVTVEAAEAKLHLNGENITVSDIPGLYSLKPYSMEERAAAAHILKKDSQLILNVCDALNLARCLNLTRELIGQNLKTAIVINMYGELEKAGGGFDKEKFERQTGVPVFIIRRADKAAKKQLEGFISRVLSQNTTLQKAEFDLEGIFTPPKYRQSFLDKIFLNNLFALPIFFSIISAVFFITFGKGLLGDFLKVALESFLQNKVKAAFASALFSLGAPNFLKGLICDGIIGGAGMLLAFVPQLAILFLFLIILEQSGYISRLAFMSDSAFSKVGLSGRAVFSMLMGFGCSAAAVITTRGLENKSLQKRTVLALPFIPCSARLPVIAMLAEAFFLAPFAVILAVYVLGVALSLIFAALLQRKIAVKEQFITELAPYRFPGAISVLKSLILELKQFIIKIGGIVLAFVVLMWLLSSFSVKMKYLGGNIDGSILAKAGGFFKYLFYPIGIKNWQIPAAMLSGLVAKETVAGTLWLLYPSGLSGAISSQSALALIVFVAVYTACISAMAATAREVGWRLSIKLALFQFAFALLLSYAVYFLYLLVLKFSYLSIVGFIISAVILLLSLNKIISIKTCRGGIDACAKCNRRYHT